MPRVRDVRRLELLEKSASSTRVLNLYSVHRNARDPKTIEALEAKPLFTNSILNRSIILKHRVRPDEVDLFDGPVGNVTKILVPLDRMDLKVGASTLFLGQKRYAQIAESLFTDDFLKNTRDQAILQILDELPSLDPFLLRERMKREHHDIALEYFPISEADGIRMRAFVHAEVARLVGMSGASNTPNGRNQVDRMVDKIMSTSPEEAFAPLKAALRMSDNDYQEGLFAWRGFLYYKWQLSQMFDQLKGLVEATRTLRPAGRPSAEERTAIASAVKTITRAISHTARQASESIRLYDTAYLAMIEDEDPKPFREFLFKAPSLFQKMGTGIGGLQHVVSFWNFRFGSAKAKLPQADEYLDILADFIASLPDPDEADAQE